MESSSPPIRVVGQVDFAFSQSHTNRFTIPPRKCRNPNPHAPYQNVTPAGLATPAAHRSPTDRTGDGPDTRPPRPLSGEHGELRVAAPGQDVSLFVCATVCGTTVTKLGWSLPHGIWSPIIPSSWRNPGPPPPASRPLAIPGRPPWPTDRRQRIAIPPPPRNTVWSSTRRAPC